MALSAKIDHRNPVEIDLFIKFHGTRIGTNAANAKCRGRNATIHSEATAARIKTPMDKSVQCNFVKIQGIHTT